MSWAWAWEEVLNLNTPENLELIHFFSPPNASLQPTMAVLALEKQGQRGEPVHAYHDCEGCFESPL
jgi:hypothetical protein